MSTFRAPIVEIGKVGKHPNADTLSITQVEGCPVIFRTGDFEQGGLAIYVPVDAVVPETVPGTEFLGEHRRIKAKRLRGVFSMGLLLPVDILPGLGGNPYANDFYSVGRDVSRFLNITKYEEPEPTFLGTDCAPAPKCQVPVYDMESYRKFKHLFDEQDLVVVTEKIHGTNSRFVVSDGILNVGSHKQWKKEDERNMWWKVAKRFNLAAKLANYPGYVLYGETYGQVQDLKYGRKDLDFAAFDVFNSNEGRWLDYHEFQAFCEELGIPTVPVLWMGPYIPEAIEPMSEGKSTLGDNIREGFVIKPVVNRYNNETGRTIFKLVGEGYLLRGGKTTEHH
jgi:RNA ligase (TIGR02306 family)